MHHTFYMVSFVLTTLFYYSSLLGLVQVQLISHFRQLNKG